MSVASKYLFDLSFDAPGNETRRSGPVTPAEPSYSRAELAAAQDKARAEGFTAGQAAAVAAHEQDLAASLAAIGDRLAALMAASAAAREASETMAIEISRVMLGKLFPAYAKKHGLDEIAALATQCMREAIDEPRLVLRVPDALFEAAQAQLKPLAAASGYPGKIVILADAALGPADCRVEWADGGAERDAQRLWQDIDQAIARACGGASAAAETP